MFRPRVTQLAKVVVVADRSYSQSALFGKNAGDLRERVFTTVRDLLLPSEHSRTGLPTAIIGTTATMNSFNEFMLGTVPQGLRFPFKTRRGDKMQDLRRITEPFGYIGGYAWGVAGSNFFSVESNGQVRFVRSLILLGNIIPDLTALARDYRGAYAGWEHTCDEDFTGLGMLTVQRPSSVDWRVAMRTRAHLGTEAEDTVVVSRNVPGYNDGHANALLFGRYEGEILQVVGRMRAEIPDPIDPSIVPTAYLIAGVAVPGLRVAEVCTLDELREGLGAPSREERKDRGRPATGDQADQFLRRFRHQGRRAAIEWKAERWLRKRENIGVVRGAFRGLFEACGLELGERESRLIDAAVEKYSGG